MNETIEQMDIRHANERRAQAFIQADVNKSKADTETHLISTTATSAFGVTVGTETTDSQYVTLIMPTGKTGMEGAVLFLLKQSLQNDNDCKCIISGDTLRVRKDRAAKVLDKIEATLSL